MRNESKCCKKYSDFDWSLYKNGYSYHYVTKPILQFFTILVPLKPKRVNQSYNQQALKKK